MLSCTKLRYKPVGNHLFVDGITSCLTLLPQEQRSVRATGVQLTTIFNLHNHQP